MTGPRSRQHYKIFSVNKGSAACFRCIPPKSRGDSAAGVYPEASEGPAAGLILISFPSLHPKKAVKEKILTAVVNR